MNYFKEIIIATIEALLQVELSRLEKMNTEYRKHRTGRLIIRRRRGRLTYSEKIGDRERGITGDRDRLHIVIRNSRLENLMKESREIISILEKTLQKLSAIKDRKVQSGLTENLKANSKYSPEMWAWMKAAYDTNPAYNQDLKYKTLVGTITRTKSEWRIASTLEEAGIPYRYEQKMYIDGKAMYPDFIIMRTDGSIVIWEHFGMMHNEEYAKSAKDKIERYRSAGFRQHTNLICTYEEDIKSQHDIDEIIKRFVIY